VNTAERSAFLRGYARLLTSAWSSRRFTERLDADPRSALASCGLTVPDGADARILDETGWAAGLDPDAAIDMWEDGYRTNTFCVFVPSTPQPDRSARLLDVLDRPDAGLLVG